VQIATANKIVIPAIAAVKFPDREVTYSDGKTLKLPIASNGDMVAADKADIPKATLLCLSFRANSQVRTSVVLAHQNCYGWFFLV
jgi:ATPase complex subunit ATP10